MCDPISLVAGAVVGGLASSSAGSGSRALQSEADRQRAEEEARQERIRQGTQKIDKTFSQFDDAFYAKQRQAYLDYATPELNRQHQEAGEGLTFNLARSGLLDSSVRGDKQAELQRQYDEGARTLTDTALGMEKQSRTAVEDARSELVRTLQATGDATQAGQAAVNRAASLSKPAQYSAVAQLFSDGMDVMGKQLAYEKANALYGAPAPRYDTGLYNKLSGAVRVSGR